MNEVRDKLRDKIARFRDELAAECARCEREPSTVELCAVSKYATTIETSAMAHALAELGMPVVLGESRVQDLLPKAAELAGEDFQVRWQLIGTLQRNKARAVAGLVDRVHSLDRPSILERLAQLGAEQGRAIEVLVQIKTSGEDEKSGFAPDDLADVLARCEELGGLRVCGLMTMAPRGTDHESARPSFAALRALRERCAPQLPHLSMGMSGDWRGALREGATILRIGSALHR